MALALLLIAAAGPARAEAPEKAVCRVCEMRGAMHGAEKVAASRTYEGKDYHFCSDKCAEAFDAFPAGYAVHPLPRPAPQAVLTTTEGEEITLGATGDGVVLVDFWATWCAPCKKAMPELERLHRELEPRGFGVVGVSIDEDAGAVEKFLRKNELGYPTAIDSPESPTWYAYSVAAIPAMFLIDGEGRIVGEWRGAIDMGTVRERVEELLGRADEGAGEGAGDAGDGEEG
ncbi:MAG TPA: redoxin domain-containing protein [bacterium]|nr:redoxin domain-containing protein [bacterium]